MGDKPTSTSGVGQGTGSTQGTVYDAHGRVRLVTYGSETTFREEWNAVTSTDKEDTPKCRAIASDMEEAGRRIDDAMEGADHELALPPSVDPGIREAALAHLASELR